MKNMFRECYALNELNLSNFNTDNVTDMSYMFLRCYALNELDISNFNFDNVTNKIDMFTNCPDNIKIKRRSNCILF